MEKLPQIFVGDIVKVTKRISATYALVIKGPYIAGGGAVDLGDEGWAYFDILLDGNKIMVRPCRLEKLPDSCKMRQNMV